MTRNSLHFSGGRFSYLLWLRRMSIRRFYRQSSDNFATTHAQWEQQSSGRSLETPQKAETCKPFAALKVTCLQVSTFCSSIVPYTFNHCYHHCNILFQIYYHNIDLKLRRAISNLQKASDTLRKVWRLLNH